MRAFVITGPRQTAVADVANPAAAPGLAVVDVERAGVCGTDVEFFTGEMAYLHQGHAEYPMRPGHEWCGTVSAVGDGVDPAWLGCRVTGDTMLGCGQCRRCRSGLHHVCADRAEIGILGGSAALAEAIRHYASGSVDPRPLVAATVGLGQVGDVLAGARPPGSGPGPKILIDPRRA
jgi:threonine dehydrogenase-like Zn-dependent dehydrogenase